MKTIASISTPIGSGAIGVIRMSGDESLTIASSLFTPFQKNITFSQAVPNTMYLGTFEYQGFKDNVLCVFFKAPHSYTGEDVVEFQCHGGIRVVREVLSACLNSGASSADKGEFTKRAFLNGKMALSDAEGIIDMINGESMASIKAAYRISSGEVSSLVNSIEDKLLECISYLEASLDFPDEMGDEIPADSITILNEALSNINLLIASYKEGKYLKNGISVAIVGIANVGKSSLLNTLLGRNRAIVTDIAGTTRDSLEEHVEINGIMLNLIDTAGIRETTDVVEKIGVERSKEVAKGSDIILFITESNRDLTQEEKDLLSSLDKNVLLVYNKSDKGSLPSNSNGIAISCKTGDGIESLKCLILEKFIKEKIDSAAGVITSSRHYEALKRASENISSVLQNISRPSELILIDLKAAYSSLGEITGNTASEDIINKIFSSFCIGK